MSDALSLEVSVRPLFATPLISALLPDAEVINKRLSRVILDRRTVSGGMRSSNVGGAWHSDRDMAVWGGPDVRTIVDLAMTLATRATAKRRPEFPDPTWALQSCWANVNEHGHANLAHYHPGAFWSGIYYVDDGGCSAQRGFEGTLEFLDPRGPSTDMYAPAASADDPSVRRGEQIEPKPGLFLLFPSTLYHQAREYRGNALRISIAFNLSRVDAPTRRVFAPHVNALVAPDA